VTGALPAADSADIMMLLDIGVDPSVIARLYEDDSYRAAIGGIWASALSKGLCLGWDAAAGAVANGEAVKVGGWLGRASGWNEEPTP
jgi:hypothetical protein